MSRFWSLSIVAVVLLQLVESPARSIAPPNGGLDWRQQFSVLETTGLIFGTVVDGVTGAALADARVALVGRADRVLTDTAGRFAFFDLPAGAYRLVATKDGYAYGAFGQPSSAPYELPSRPGENSTRGRAIELGPGERRTGLTVRLWKFGVIAGRVRDEFGEALVGVQVQAIARVARAGRYWLTADMPHWVRTDDRGEYRLANLPQGNYVVAVRSPLIAVSTTGQPPSATFDRPWSPQLLALQRQFQTPFPLAGTSAVLDEDAWLQALAGQPVPSSLNGTTRAYPSTFYPGVLAPSDASVLTVRAGHETSGLDLRLAPEAAWSLVGTVVGFEGAQADVSVSLAILGDTDDPSSEFPTGVAVTDGAGRFRFSRVTPGRYRLRAERVALVGRPQYFTPSDAAPGSGFVFVRGEPWGDSPTLAATADVVVGKERPNEIALALRPGVRLAGRVQFDGTAARPAPDAVARIWLELDRADGYVSSIQMPNQIAVNATGSLRSIELLPARYFLRSIEAPVGWWLDSAMVDGQDMSRVAVALDGGSRSIVVTFTDRVNELAGVVRDIRGSPAADATVAMFPVDQALWRDYGSRSRRHIVQRTDSLGRYRAMNLPPGDYFLVATADDAIVDWHAPDLFEALSRRAQQISVERQVSQRYDLTVHTLR